MIEGKYEMTLEHTQCFHFRAWLEDDGERVSPIVGGCSVRSHYRNRNRKYCERRAIKACHRLLREHELRVAAGEPVVRTVAFDHGRGGNDA